MTLAYTRVRTDIFLPYLFRLIIPSGLHHIAALRREGLDVWDASTRQIEIREPFVVFATADGPGLTTLNGLVGHCGKIGCRLHCPLPSRRKPEGKHYYPVLLKPDNYSVRGCDHGDVDIWRLSLNCPSAGLARKYRADLRFVQESQGHNQYENRRRETGIGRPSIFDGLPPNSILGIPAMFPGDCMHIISLNITDLLLGLWRGTIACDDTDRKASWTWAVLRGQTWQNHGKAVAACTPHLPGSFDRPPRNPALKISSGYKAWEFLMYIFGLGPGLLYQVLPATYWKNFCKLVTGVRLLLQRSVTRLQLQEAHRLLIGFAIEFELIYLQRRFDRIHFVCQSIHYLMHMAPETSRVGPNLYYSQWPIERTIGNLGEELKQHSNPYRNFSERCVLRAQVNTLKVMAPELDRNRDKIPRGAIELGDGYFLLHATDSCARNLRKPENDALKQYIEQCTGLAIEENWATKVVRWARVKLPNGQISRCVWKETRKPLNKLRISRNVKVSFSHIFAS
jgi:hypothetical protein